ncbi:outer membrane beta-barrel family protein [Brumimicrobium aurantiacum]|uniref:TonB-dependent receptor n=1 Tax=Brumimicrobium aurantiacum TaxID=1737063 RepID=A0A3E1F1J8_9FLAO|nr:outer membrane beta-barrel family protein [Brumimicrobium aurantiacum]RFC55686.1 TonB-dependent receptor [Brumimicrobium aurantiacum]
MRSFIMFTLLLFGMLSISNNALAQAKPTNVTGLLKEKQTKQVLPYATVVLRSMDTSEVLSGTTTDEDGKFQLSTKSQEFLIEISFMGYTTKYISDYTITDGTVDLGEINLESESQAIDEVEVRGEVSKTVFKLDKRVFNVGKDLSSTGMSGLEVLDNVPSVNVGIDGDITLRGGAGVQILINGKPSVLADESGNALGTITADMIESVEVITNASAKYEASGTAGILNIILKKEEKKGWNGSVTANTGYPDNHSIGLSLNRRTEKFNLFTQLGGGYRKQPRFSESRNFNKITEETILSEGENYRNEKFFNITLGTDYHINDYNVITLSGNYALEMEDQPSETDFSYLDSNGDLVSSWTRTEVTDAINPKWQYDLNYKKQFRNNKEHTLQLSALGSFFGKDQSSQFTSRTNAGLEENRDQRTATNFNKVDYTFKADYMNPITDAFTLELGSQYVINNVGNDFMVEDYVVDEYVVDQNQTNDFEYEQNVLGIYSTLAYEREKWGVKGGLRVENTELNTFLVNTEEENNQNFTDFFPTLHTSYKVSDKLSFQAGYSKRIYRPRLWDLNPFFNISNNYNIRAGNPNLLSEYTDSYEITSIYRIGKASFSSSLYHQYTTDVIERVSTIEGNTVYSRPYNVGTNSKIGFETNGKYIPSKWLTINADFNFNYFDRKGTFENQNFNFTGSQWSLRMTPKFKLKYDIDLELTGRYQSGYETVQGETSAYATLDIGVRKKILKGKVMLNLSVRDVFQSRIRENFVSQETFENYSYGVRSRQIAFGISYGFGKGEAMNYSGRRR